MSAIKINTLLCVKRFSSFTLTLLSILFSLHSTQPTKITHAKFWFYAVVFIFLDFFALLCVSLLIQWTRKNITIHFTCPVKQNLTPVNFKIIKLKNFTNILPTIKNSLIVLLINNGDQKQKLSLHVKKWMLDGQYRSKFSKEDWYKTKV